MKNKFTNKEYITMYENYKNLCANMVSQVTKYESWSDEFSRSEIKKLYSKIIKEFKGIDFTVFTEEELKKLGFKNWDEEIILAPIWVIECLSEGTEMTSISGNTIKVGDEELDLDIRMGVTAYGFNKAQLRDSKIEEVLEK
jgi:hypothetical protein